MKELRFYFDIVSPYAYLAFEHLPQALSGLSYTCDYQPVLFAGLLRHWGNKGPAEIEPKREWTYRHVQWLARRHGIRLDLPAAHPFNPLPQLRLLVARGLTHTGLGLPNRFCVRQAFAQAWQGGGAAADDPQRLAALRAELLPPERAARADPDSERVKHALRDATERAAARGVFGVPTIEVDDLLFFGFDALPMLADYLREGDAAAALTREHAAARAVGAGVVRRVGE